MSTPIANAPPTQLDTHRLADAIAELVTDDLDDLYGRRMLDLKSQPRGPQRDLAQAASTVAYLSTRLLRHVLRYQRSLSLVRAHELQQELDDESFEHDDIPW